MKDEEKQSILFFWNKIEEMLYGTPRFAVKPQETFEKIESSLTRDALSEVLKEYNDTRRRASRPISAPLPSVPPTWPGNPPPGLPPPSSGIPMAFNPMSMEPPGARMGPGSSGPPSMEDEIRRLKGYEEIVHMLIILMERERSKYGEDRLYRLVDLVLELGGHKVKR